MERQVMVRAAVGATLIGVGLSVMLSASRHLPCEDCAEKREAGAEVVAEVEEPVADD